MGLIKLKCSVIFTLHNNICRAITGIFRELARCFRTLTCYQRLKCNDNVIWRLLLRVKLGTMDQQLRTTWREEVAQTTHVHRTSCKDEEKQKMMIQPLCMLPQKFSKMLLRMWSRIFSQVFPKQHKFVTYETIQGV